MEHASNAPNLSLSNWRVVSLGLTLSTDEISTFIHQEEKDNMGFLKNKKTGAWSCWEQRPRLSRWLIGEGLSLLKPLYKV